MSIETMTKLATVTVGAGGSTSIDFTNIPQGYTDLCIVLSIKDSSTGASGASYLDVQFNGSTSTYTPIRAVGYGSSTTSNAGQTSGFLSVGYFGNSRTSMASSFTSAELYIYNYSNSNPKLISSTYSMPDNTTTGPYNGFGTGLWDKTSPITSVKIQSDGSNMAQFSTATLYGVKALRTAAGNSIKATGGNIAFDGTYVYHKFIDSGVFTPYQNLTVDYLVVAGGGGGGASSGGGGGAGGLRSSVTASGGSPGTAESPALSVTAQAYVVTVGAGGAGGPGSTSGIKGTAGSNSVFSTITSIGGGGAAGTSGGNAATTGGSGGGGFSGTSAAAGTTNQGFAGGESAGGDSAGGGGGAGAVGQTAPSTSQSGAGGAGVATSITGSSVTYAGGGGGGRVTTSVLNGAGGTGGGGAGATGTGGGTAGTANTGGGGGGGYWSGSVSYAAGAGGAGIVIIRYKG